MLKVLHDLGNGQYYVLSKPAFHRSPHQRLHLILWLGPRWLLLTSIQLRHAQHQEGSFTLHNKWFLLSSDYILNNSWCSHDPTIFSDLFSNVKVSLKMISRENLSEYDKNGYFFIKGLFSIEELQPLINESETFSSHPSKFSVKDAQGNPAQLISWTHLANDFIGLLPRLKKMVSIP